MSISSWHYYPDSLDSFWHKSSSWHCRSGISSGILSDISSGHSIWHSDLAYLLAYILTWGLLAFYLCILSWHIFWQILIWTFYLHSFNLSAISCSYMRSGRDTLGVDTSRTWGHGREHLAWILAVEVRQGTLGVKWLVVQWSRQKNNHGPRIISKHWESGREHWAMDGLWLRFQIRAHWAWMVVVEVTTDWTNLRTFATSRGVAVGPLWGRTSLWGSTRRTWQSEDDECPWRHRRWVLVAQSQR